MIGPGDRVDRYVIEDTLGQGGMGTVFRAYDERLHRHVALKLVHRAPGDDDDVARDAAARLLREARAAAALAHPNVVVIHDCGELEDGAFIVMELVVGATLRARIRDRPPLETRLSWLRDMASALSAAHHAGLVHRDVKPENVLVSDEGVVKVVDFGICRRFAEGALVESAEVGQESFRPAAIHTITAAGVVVGTPLYMAPEQLRTRNVDGRADQFAWGVVAYELCAGVPPWSTTNAMTLVADIVGREPESLQARAPEVPAGIEAIVLRALRKDPGKRFASMDAIVEALDRGGVVEATETTAPKPTARASNAGLPSAPISVAEATPPSLPIPIPPSSARSRFTRTLSSRPKPRLENVAFTLVGEILVSVHNREALTEVEFEELLTAIRALSPRPIRLLVVTEGGGPNALQRSRLSRALTGGDPRAALVSDDPAVSRTVVALSWSGWQVRAFSTGEIDGAFGYLQVAPHWRYIVECEVDRLRSELIGP